MNEVSKMKPIAATIPLFLWSSSALAVNMLSVGATSGNMASGDAFSAGDISGSWTHISETDFNALSLTDLMSYDVIVVQWASGEMDLDWDTKMSTFVEAGGGYWFEDPNNMSDLGSMASASAPGCNPGTLVDTVPGLTDGITNDFVNCHIVFDSWASYMNPLLDDGGQTTMLWGEYGGGRVILSGPDHDYHAVKGGAADANNQYNFVLNIVNWISDGCEEATFYADADGDGYGNASTGMMACEAPSGYVTDASDCDDTDSAVNPGATEVCDGIDNNCDSSVDPDSSADAATWYADSDADGYGDTDSFYSVTACSVPTGYVADSSDCNDADGAVNPGATEVCDGIDNDCDTVIDPDDSADAITWYEDADLDGYGDPSILWATEACELPTGFTALADATDCNDLDAAVNPAASEVCDGIDNNCDGAVDPDDSIDALTWYADADGDTYGDAATTSVSCTAGTGFVSDASDCDDTAAAVNPAATEVCDGIDNDCDAVIDPDDSADAATWYADADADGFGDAATTSVSCAAGTGFVSDATDCDDAAAAVNPAATEVCDGIDNDCDGAIDPDDSADATTWYEDYDGDGYGDPDPYFSTTACSLPSGYTGAALARDCDDVDATINPDAVEACDGVDNDCDGEIDTDDAVDALTWYADTDADGFGDADSTDVACYESDGWVADATDCDDTDAAVNPAATEVCDGIDNDCDGDLDPSDSDDVITWYSDGDGDGYGDALVTLLSCEGPDGWVTNGDDCDDADAAVSPDGEEVCDGIDNDCDAVVDGPDSSDALTFYPDNDGDGFGLETFEEVCEDTAVDCDTGSADMDSGLDDTGGCVEEVCTDVSSALTECAAPDGYVEDNTDCDDEDAEVYPDAPGLDADCEALEDTGDAGDDTGDAGDDTGDAGDDTGEGGDDDGDTGSASDIDDDSDKLDMEECGCATGSLAGSSPWLAMLALIGLARRRQS